MGSIPMHGAQGEDVVQFHGLGFEIRVECDGSAHPRFFWPISSTVEHRVLNSETLRSTLTWATRGWSGFDSRLGEFSDEAADGT